MGLATSTVEATDGERSQGRDGEKEDPSILNAKLPEEFTSRFEVLEEIGKGSFGLVYKVRDKKTKAIYATKHQKYNESNMKEASGPAMTRANSVSCFLRVYVAGENPGWGGR